MPYHRAPKRRVRMIGQTYHCPTVPQSDALCCVLARSCPRRCSAPDQYSTVLSGAVRQSQHSPRHIYEHVDALLVDDLRHPPCLPHLVVRIVLLLNLTGVASAACHTHKHAAYNTQRCRRDVRVPRSPPWFFGRCDRCVALWADQCTLAAQRASPTATVRSYAFGGGSVGRSAAASIAWAARAQWPPLRGAGLGRARTRHH